MARITRIVLALYTMPFQQARSRKICQPARSRSTLSARPAANACPSARGRLHRHAQRRSSGSRARRAARVARGPRFV
jgi:hypothetical protein